MIGEVKLIDSVEHNRLQIFFPDKPSAEVRTLLKQQGFRWSGQRRGRRKRLFTITDAGMQQLRAVQQM